MLIDHVSENTLYSSHTNREWREKHLKDNGMRALRSELGMPQSAKHNEYSLFSKRESPIALYIYLTIRPVARKGYGSIAHEAKPNGLLIRGP